MRRLCAALFTVLLLACKEKPQPVSAPPSPAARPTQAQGWTRADLASSLNADPTRPSSQPALAISDGQPAVAWREGHRIYVKRWDGTAWRALHSPLNHDPNRQAQKPVLIAPADGTLAAAWLEMDPNDHSDVRVAIWNGSAWTPVGDTANPSGTTVDELKLLSTPGGLVVSSGQRYQGGPRQLFVRRWSGTAWQRLGPGPLNTAAGSEVKDDPRLALLSGTDLVVAWLESAPLTGVRGFVRRWDESAGSWEELPAPGGIDGDSRIAMTSSRSGELVLGRSWNSGLRPYTRLRNAKDTWTDIGLPDAKMENGGYIPVHLVAPGTGSNSVATLSSWQDALHLAHWDGARWEVMAPSVASEAHKASEPALIVGPDGTVYVSWIDTRNEPAQLFVTSYKASRP